MFLGEITLLLLLFGAAAADLRSGKIPNMLTLAGLTAGILWSVLTKGPPGILFSVPGILLPLMIPGVLFLFHMIGAGDVKLLMMTGAFTGISRIFRITILSFLIGGLFSLILLIRRDNFLSRFQYLASYIKKAKSAGFPPYLEGVGDDGRFCFSVPVLTAVLICLLRGGL